LARRSIRLDAHRIASVRGWARACSAAREGVVD
jgi:hypothetical protein